MKCVSKIKASVLTLALACGLMLSPATMAWAAQNSHPAADESIVGTPPNTVTPDYTATWTVTFNGEEMVSDDHLYNQVISGLQPGDTARFEISLVNDCDKDVDWYVKNWIADSMEQNAGEGNEGAAYTYTLTYFDSNEDINNDAGTVIYSNDMVGGEEDEATVMSLRDDSESGEATEGGLLNATADNGMDDYFHLGTFAADEVRHMVLTMGIDGETHTNGYFDTDAGAWLQYAAEPVGTGEEIVTTERTITYEYERDPRTVGGDLPQTGDMLPTISVICLILGLLVLMCGLASWMNDRKNAKRGQE